MSIFRQAAITTAIVGVGFGAMSGAAFANESVSPVQGGDSCSNEVAASNENGADRTLGDTTGGPQDISADNVCDILSDNDIANDANIAALAGVVRDGDNVNRESTMIDIVTETIGL